jgi:NAD(P)-dependent dehydrogenase (short-subunit alcohol dehydrogenase family)
MTTEHFVTTGLNNVLNSYRIIVTGCGYAPRRRTFYNVVTKKHTHDPILIDGQEYKLNIGAATAIELALSGATVHMVSNSLEKLDNLKMHVDLLLEKQTSENGGLVEYSAVDLLDEQHVETLVSNLREDKPLYWVHSLGLGAGNYRLVDDNPYLRIEDIPTDLFKQEFSITEATHTMVRKLLPRLRKQSQTKIVIVTSMSAIRFYPYGAVHCAAKSALDAYAKVLDLELFNENIFVTKIRPGMVDTGMYDAQVVQDANIEIAKFFGMDITEAGIQLAPPSSVAKIIATILANDAHIPSINLIAMGQETTEGS